MFQLIPGNALPKLNLIDEENNQLLLQSKSSMHTTERKAKHILQEVVFSWSVNVNDFNSSKGCRFLSFST